MLVSEVADETLLFAIDFHSTFRDVLYAVDEDSSRKPGGLLRCWIEALDARYPGRFQEQPFAATSTVFNYWIFNTFDAPAVTYEVDDATPPVQLAGMAGHAAVIFMRLIVRGTCTRPVGHARLRSWP